MKKLSVAALAIGLAIPLHAIAGEPEGTAIELKDGGKIVVEKDGKTYHTDTKGKRVRMRDGVAMEGKDGKRYLMKNDAIWQQISGKGMVPWNR